MAKSDFPTKRGRSCLRVRGHQEIAPNSAQYTASLNVCVSVIITRVIVCAGTKNNRVPGRALPQHDPPDFTRVMIYFWNRKNSKNRNSFKDNKKKLVLEN